MHILAHVHKYPPVHNAGAEWMLHTFLREMVKRGHEARVLAWTNKRTFEGVHIERVGTRSAPEAHAWADIVLTHLDLTREAVALAQSAGKPVVHMVHNDKQLAFNEVDPERTALVIFNSDWLAAKVAWPGASIVIHPPVDPAHYRVTPGEALTLINLSAAKGAELFYDLAARMPDRQFLGVRGAYARQIVPRVKPKNVTILPHQADIRRAYGKTRILLMPSSYESWGRVALEAAASGIPTIAHPTPGLLESLGGVGIFADRDDSDAWVEAIEALDEPEAYQRASRGVAARAEALRPEADFVRFEAALRQAVGERPRGGDVDFLATQPQYVDHLAPVWSGLNGERGRFYVPSLKMRQHAAQRGVEATIGEPLGKGLIAVASYADYKRAPGRPVVLMEHGAGQHYGGHHPGYAGGQGKDNVVLFLAPSAAVAERNATTYPKARSVVVGCPKIDRWASVPWSRNPEPVIAVSFHWECKIWPESRSAWSYFKTGLPALVKQFPGRVLGHGHPRVFARLVPEYARLGIEPVQDFEDVLARADVYACDNSSTIFEFAATGRPVVLMNAPWYRRDVNHGLRFWDAATVGVQVDDPVGMLEAVMEALERPVAGREQALALAYTALDGKATDRAVEAIRGVLVNADV